MHHASLKLDTRGGARENVDVQIQALTKLQNHESTNACDRKKTRRMQGKVCMEADSQCKGRIQPALLCLIIQH